MNKHINNYLINGEPWAITDGWLEKIHAIANREHDLQAVLAQRGEPLKNTRAVEMRGSVAIIPVTGVLFPRATWFSEVSGATSVEQIIQDLKVANDNPSVKSIILNFDTPGGSTAFINEAAKTISQSTKPVIAYGGVTVASGGYWLASAANEIVVDEMAILGSIGVVSQIRGKKEDGTLEIVSSNAPDKRPDYSTQEGIATHQRLIDDMEAVFINAVTTNRNLSAEQVTAVRGGVLVGQKAVDAGFADRIGTLEGLIQELNSNSTTTRSNPMDLSKLKAEHPAVYQAAFDEGKASMQTELAALNSKLNDSATAATTTERVRIAAILGSEEAKGREAQAQHIAFNTAMTQEDAKAMMASAPVSSLTPQTPANPLHSAMAGFGNPKVTPDGTTNAGSEDDPATLKADAERIAAMVNPKTRA